MVLGQLLAGVHPAMEETEEPVYEFCGEPAMQCDCRGFITAHLTWPHGRPVDPQEE